jgi:hypothetical protein
MATGWEMIPDTAKALSAPLTKLVEVIAAGCGKVYGPTDIRRTARAQGDAAVILAEAEFRRSEVALRAAHRLLQIEEVRQHNIDSISAIAAEQLSEEVSDVPVDSDWATRFFREAQDVSNEQMQQIWGKLLAGEVTKPGSFSTRTLAVVSNLSSVEAAKFGFLCSFVSKVMGNGLATFLTDVNSPLVRSKGLSFEGFEALQAAGLVVHAPFSGRTLTMPQSTATLLIERPGNLLLIATGTLANVPAGALNLGTVSLTPAGTELFSIADWTSAPEYDAETIKVIESCTGWTIEKKLIVQRLTGQVRHIPWPAQ